MFVGIGVGIGRQRFAGGFADSYSARVLADGGTIESLSCVASASALLQTASLLLIPSGYKAGVAYSALPNNGNGDLTWSRNSTANRTQSNGNIGSVGANVPRLSYMYGSCPAALLEPQRTNLVLYSEQFDNATWGKNNVSVSANSATAPDNTTTADLVTALATTSAHLLTNASHPATTVTASLYAKKNTHNFIQIFSGWASTAFANFDLNNGVVGTVGFGTIASIQSVGNGWYRCTITTNATATSTVRWCLVSSSTAVYNESWTANGTESVYFWGAQLESGSYPTTYIPTTTASATRLADTFTRNNIYTNGLISASGGTWFVELKNNIAYPRVSGYPTLFISSNTVGTSTLTLGFASNVSATRLVLYSWISGAFTSIGTTSTDNVKVAFAFTTTTLKVFVNGSVFASYTGLTIAPTTIQNLIGIAEVPLFIQQMALFNSPLSDSDCQLLTT